MATTKLCFVTLLLCGIILVVLGSQVKHTEAVCPKNCDGIAEYMICPYAPEGESKVKEVSSGICTNCCAAKEQGCILLNHNGIPYCPVDEVSSLPRKIIASIV